MCANVDDVVDVDADVFKAVLFCGSNIEFIDAGVGFELAPAVGEKAGAERFVPGGCVPATGAWGMRAGCGMKEMGGGEEGRADGGGAGGGDGGEGASKGLRRDG